MNLYNCETKEELELKQTKVEELGLMELLDLTVDIKDKFDERILQDENIVIDSMMSIILELIKRANN